MSKLKYNLVGQQFGMLTVIERVPIERYSDQVKWLCKCECGKERIRSSAYLKYVCPTIRNCGCQEPETNGSYINPYTAREIMSKHLGRRLTSDELVHHKNGMRWDNDIGNLELCTRGRHPYSQRVSNVLEFSLSFIKEYAPELLIHKEYTFISHCKQSYE